MSVQRRASVQYDYTLKVVSLGNGSVGKTSLIHQFKEGTFNPDYVATLGTIFSMKIVDYEISPSVTTRVRLIMWDLAGQRGYQELQKRYMQGASGGFIVYDVTNPDTFESVIEWYNRFHEECPEAIVILVANKVDLPEIRVAMDEGERTARFMNAEFYQTSAKDGRNVEDLFYSFIRQAFAERGFNRF